MTVAVQMPQGEGIASQILKGLSIAQSIYGIKADRAKYEAMAKKEEEAKKRQQILDAAEGAYTDKQIADKFTTQGRKVSDTQFEGGIRIPRIDLATGELTERFVGPEVLSPKDRAALEHQNYLADRADRRDQKAEARANTELEFKKSQQIEEAQKRYDGLTKDTRERLASIESAMKLADKADSNPIAASALTSQLARISGESGVLTDADIERYGGEASLKAKMERAIQLQKDGTMRKEDIAFSKDLISTFSTALEKQRLKSGEEESLRFAQAWGGDSSQHFEKITGKSYAKEHDRVGKMAEELEKKMGAGGIANISPEEAKAELARRRAAQQGGGLSVPGGGLSVPSMGIK